MPHDIEQIIERLKAEMPGVKTEQLQVSHPADDNGIWFFKVAGKFGTVQIESSDGTCPFLIESDSSAETQRGHTVDDVVAKVKDLLGKP